MKKEQNQGTFQVLATGLSYGALGDARADALSLAGMGQWGIYEGCWMPMGCVG